MRMLQAKFKNVPVAEWGMALALTFGPLALLPASGGESESMFMLRAAHAEEMAKVDASRLVTVGGSLTEIVFALGEGERLVGRDTTSTYPGDVGGLPDVGYMRQLAPEGVLSVEPTAILAIEGSGPPETIAVLQDARVPFVLVPESYTSDGVIEKIRTVGAALGTEEAAEKLASGVAADLDAAEELAASREERKRVLFALTIEDGRIMAAGRDTAADGMIALAGADNVIDDFSGYRPVSDEAVIEAAPDAVLVMNRAGDHAIEREALLAHPAVAASPAGEAGAVIFLEGSYMLGFGPRTGAAALDLAADPYGPAATPN